MRSTEKPKTEARKRAATIIRRLRKEFDSPRTALEFQDPFQLLVATILSAQCTDERVNKVTPGLFRKYKGPKAFASASQEELEQDIRSTGFFRNKARNIIACSQELMEKHSGQVPEDFEELVLLPGVGRKTANCVMGGAYGINSGVVVDTHVQRLSGRLGLSGETHPEKIERDLMELVARKDWYDLSNLLILHGRKTCNARKPLCETCSLLDICPTGTDLLGERYVPSRTDKIRPGNRKA